MATKTIECVIITCDSCGEGYGSDYEIHYSSLNSAIRDIGPGEQPAVGQRIDTWLVSEDGSATCDDCRQRAREAACPAHAWDDEPYPWRYCRLCYAWFRERGDEGGE